MTTATVRERLVEAASAITTDRGWSAVTMGKVATRAGVSRQTVYNELGSKPALGQAMVLRELERFLAVVVTELDSNPDIVEAIRAAARRILEMARDNPLLRSILTTAHAVDGTGDGSSELLPFLTTDADPLIAAASAVIAEHVPGHGELTVTGAELDAAIDAIVRLVLSHVMQPGGDPDRTADDIAWIAARVLRP
ncbi:MAG: TetR family transcriptional regulator [Nocardioidaceae bacterium]